MTELVKQRGINHIFPKTIPRKRSKNDVKIKSFFGCFFILAGVLMVDNKLNFLVVSVTYCYLLFVIIELVLRMCHLCEEYFHMHSRYEGNIWKMLTHIFCFNNINKIVFSFAFCLSVTMGNPIKSFKLDGHIPWIFSFVGTYIFTKIMNLEKCLLHTAKLMDELKGLDYGSGMAHSFFQGYLNLILPCTGDERKGLKEQIEDYESKHNVTFGTKKLYILIPLSCYCPTSIAQFSNCMEASESLNWRKMDRAGVARRQYHNSVYKLWHQNQQTVKPIYVCAEYATPLLTLHEVMRQNTPESRWYKLYQKEIVTNFFMTLDHIIKTNRDCRDFAELIYYRDIDNEGNPLDRNQLDIGHLLLERINQEKISS